MTQTRNRGPAARPTRTKLRAVQRLFYDNRLVEEGEVFWYVGDELPTENIAHPVPEDTPLGVYPEPEEYNAKNPPPWSTKGFVERSTRSSGRDDALDELLS